MLTLTLATALLLAAPLAAQQDLTPEELQSRYDLKIAKPFVASGGWVLDYDLARDRAVKEKKYLFVYFTRSYAG
jgi:hypothetical protein